jgi:hypothetical protein
MREKKNKGKIKEELKKVSSKEFDSVIRKILSTPPQTKKKKAHNINKEDVKNHE